MTKYIISDFQGLLPFEMEPNEDINEDMDTESAMHDFVAGSLDPESSEDRHNDELTDQIKIYVQNKPRKKKKSTERE